MGVQLNFVKKNERYKDFIFFDNPIPFSELYKNVNLPLVQVHDIEYEKHIGLAGFCGSFSWADNNITSLDGDTYCPEMLVYGYKEFAGKDGEKGLDILTDHNW